MRERGLRTGIIAAGPSVFCAGGVEVSLGLLGDEEGVLAFVCFGHDCCRRKINKRL